MKYAIVTMIGMVVIAGCVTLHCMDTPETPETPPAEDKLYLDDLVVEVPERAFVKGKIQSSTQRDGVKRIWIRSGMPCDLYQGENDEQETSEEVVTEAPTESGAVCDAAYCEPIPTTTVPETTWLAPSSEEISHPAPVETTPQDKLLTALRNAGIEWWWPYAYAQVTQESHWDPNAVNANGLDFGLLQYRLKSPDGTRIYWTEPESIFDVDAQIRKYVSQVSARIAAGLSIEEIISRHITSDYVTEINWEYVNLVLSHMN